MYRIISNMCTPPMISKNKNTDGKLAYVTGNRREYRLIQMQSKILWNCLKFRKPGRFPVKAFFLLLSRDNTNWISLLLLTSEIPIDRNYSGASVPHSEDKKNPINFSSTSLSEGKAHFWEGFSWKAESKESNKTATVPQRSLPGIRGGAAAWGNG